MFGGMHLSDWGASFIMKNPHASQLEHKKGDGDVVTVSITDLSFFDKFLMCKDRK